MKKIITASLIIAIAFYAIADRDENIVFIKKHTTGFFEIEYCPIFFKSPSQVIDFSFFPKETNAEVIFASIGTLTAKGKVVFIDSVEDKKIIYKKSDMYRPYIWNENVRVTDDFPWTNKCRRYKLLVKEPFDEDLQISLWTRGG